MILTKFSYWQESFFAFVAVKKTSPVADKLLKTRQFFEFGVLYGSAHKSIAMARLKTATSTAPTISWNTLVRRVFGTHAADRAEI
jgi:hypothetical protein